jgi:lactoylglutathione lyase
VDDAPRVTEMRLVVTASDYEEALRFYRDVLGLPERAAYSSPGGQVTIMEAGRATLELADPPHAAYIDEVEVGRRVAGHIRVAFGVAFPPSPPSEVGGATCGTAVRPVCGRLSLDCARRAKSHGGLNWACTWMARASQLPDLA